MKNHWFAFFFLFVSPACFSQFTFSVQGGLLHNKDKIGGSGGLAARYVFLDKLALGLTTFYGHFGKKEFDDENFSSEADGRVVPFLVSAEYYLLHTKLRPFVGVDAGEYFYKYHLYNAFTNTTNASPNPTYTTSPTVYYHGRYFGIAPKIGLSYPISLHFSAFFTLQYHQIFIKDKYKELYGGKSLYGASLGISYSLGH